jgi:hypothetical protein
MAEILPDDIRASVAAGILTEAQAARVLAVAEDRHGFRSHMPDDDEPFELFRGFSEIFVTVGLALLTSGTIGLSLILGNPLAIPVVAAVISVLFARYFTLRRRMTLPSIFLAGTFGFSVFVLAAILLLDAGDNLGTRSLLAFALTGAALLAYFRTFRVPFVMFLTGLCGIGIAYSLTGILLPDAIIREGLESGFGDFLDLGRSPVLATTLLLFGLAAFAGAMVFDLRDPHRISRHAASAFWLHILAAPAIVNVVAVSLLGVGGTAGYLLAALALALITIAALIIDRRSFLTAGIIYIGVILTWAISSAQIDESWGVVWTLLVMGVFITWLGAWWVPMRGGLMRALPDFPLKSQLPPYPDKA